MMIRRGSNGRGVTMIIVLLLVKTYVKNVYFKFKLAKTFYDAVVLTVLVVPVYF